MRRVARSLAGTVAALSFFAALAALWRAKEASNASSESRAMAAVESRLFEAFLAVGLGMLASTAFVVLTMADATRARRERLAALRGRCPSCDYDLHATPDRCPECGAAATKR